MNKKTWEREKERERERKRDKEKLLLFKQFKNNVFCKVQQLWNI